MDKFLIRKSKPDTPPLAEEIGDPAHVQPSSSQSRIEVILANLTRDPGLRTRISEYHPNDQDQIRRAYLQKGPFQPRNHDFPRTKFSDQFRRFSPSWFDEYPNWLEYSIAKDAAFCLCCYLFKPSSREAGTDAFVVEGFKNWKKKEKLKIHIGGPNSSHNIARRSCDDLLNQNQHIRTVVHRQSDRSRHEYRVRLNASIDCIRFLLRQGLAFRGHDESEDSSNQGNFLELLQFLANHNDDIKSIVLQNAPENLKLTSPDVQKDIVNAAAVETTKVIIKELGDAFFSLLVDECRDISSKEQMAVALRFVDKRGRVIERFIGIVHVSDTTSISLKTGIEALFSNLGLSLTRLRGQGYDGASNMRGEFNGLKALIMKENESAFYIHCFAHQLQLALVAVAKNHLQIASLFNLVANMLNVVGASCKRRDILREKQAVEVIKNLEMGELSSGRGLNQEITLKRAGDTRWSSHYGALMNLIILYSSVISVLEKVMEDGSNPEQRAEACALLDLMQSFDFVFCLHLMREILGITNELSQALQRKDQDIVNAMALVKISKQRMQTMRDDGWDTLIANVSSFCVKHDIIIPNMDDVFVPRGRSRRKAQEMSNLHHYRIELFYTVIDMQLSELNNRFTEANTELLLCVGCLNPSNSFTAFDKKKLIRLAEFYPTEFSALDLMGLNHQLDTYIIDMRSNSEFSEVKGIAGLAEKMVELKKDTLYPSIYLLVKLALTLPVATATVERAFSAMSIVKSRLRNRMGDQWMNDNLIAYIEKDMFDSVENDVIIQRFQNMKTRRGQL